MSITEKLSSIKGLKPIIVRGKEYLPLIEGGKGIAATNGYSSGAFAATGAIGTFSGVNNDTYDEDGNIIRYEFKSKTRRERHEELVQIGIEGGVTHAKIAHEMSNGQGQINMNVLWEMGGAERILHGVLERTKGLVHGVTCGAGMPYRLSEIAEKYDVNYYPIVSSMRAFRALWKRAYSKSVDLLAGVVYEDPWLAGGHNGLSNSENPTQPQDPFPRVAEIRKFMNEVGLQQVPIIMAGGVWALKDWTHWLDNPEIGPIAFQFGTRPLLTKESPIPEVWKKRLLTLKPGDVYLNKFSPTGFYSSAVENDFLKDMIQRKETEVEYRTAAEEGFSEALPLPPRGRPVYVSPEGHKRATEYMQNGYDTPMKTPVSTLVFVTSEKSKKIVKDQIECMGCLSHCGFSNWKDHDDFTTGKKADPRSFCIQKALQNIAHADTNDDIENNLMFAGHNAYKFSDDPFYDDGFVPSVAELVDRILIGE